MGIARSASMKLNVGTSGYSYKGWKGSFYPERIPAKEMLGFYASRLLAVEINNTFYRLLRGRNCALVGVDSEDVDSPQLVATARWGYLRLRRSGYDRADLADWVQRIRSQGWEEAFVFFKHEADGPRLAAEFVEIAEGALPRKVPALAHTAAGRKTG